MLIETGIEIKDVLKSNGTYSIGGRNGFEKIIYCGDIRKMPVSWQENLKQKGVDIACLEQLKSNSTSNFFVKQTIAHNYEINSYVVQDKRTRSEVAAAKKVLEAEGIFLLGRFAQWEYYNMDKCIEAAFAVAEKLNQRISEN